MRRAGAKFSIAKDAISDTVSGVKSVFENHKVMFTIGTSILSAGAAWAGYCARQMHQQHVETRLDSIEKAMKVRREDLDADELKLLTRSGIGFKAGFATLGTVSVITYVLGWRSGRKFTLKQIHRKQQKLLAAAAASSSQSRTPLLKRISFGKLKPLSAWRQLQDRRRNKLEAARRPRDEDVQVSATSHCA